MGGHNDTPQIGGADYWAPAAWSVCVCVVCGGLCALSEPVQVIQEVHGPGERE